MRFGRKVCVCVCVVCRKVYRVHFYYLVCYLITIEKLLEVKQSFQGFILKLYKYYKYS